MEESKGNLSTIYEVLEQQKKLEEVQALFLNVIGKVNHVVDAIAVENLQLQIDDNIKEEPTEEISPPKETPSTSFVVNNNAINSQYLDMLEAKPCYNEEEVETDEELDAL